MQADVLSLPRGLTDDSQSLQGHVLALIHNAGRGFADASRRTIQLAHQGLQAVYARICIGFLKQPCSHSLEDL